MMAQVWPGQEGMLEQRGSHNFKTMARLDAGVSLQQARAEIEAIGARLAEEFPDDNAGVTPIIIPETIT